MPSMRGGPGGAIDKTRQPVLVLPDMGASRFLPVRGRVVVSLAVWREWRWPDSRESAVPQDQPGAEAGRDGPLPQRWPVRRRRGARESAGRGRGRPRGDAARGRGEQAQTRDVETIERRGLNGENCESSRRARFAGGQTGDSPRGPDPIDDVFHSWRSPAEDPNGVAEHV